MRGPYKYEKLDKYPHLSKIEGDIWSRFIDKNPGMLDEVYYDVEIGYPRPNDEELKPEWEQNRQYLGKYKIDVLGRKDGAFVIIELKHEATTKAMGEIWLYDAIFKKDWKPEHFVENWIITDTEMPHVREVAEEDGVEVFVV